MARVLASHWRIAVSGRDLPEFIKTLEDPVKAAVSYARNPPKIGFIFNGQGSSVAHHGAEVDWWRLSGLQASLVKADDILLSYRATWPLMGEDEC